MTISAFVLFFLFFPSFQFLEFIFILLHFSPFFFLLRIHFGFRHQNDIRYTNVAIFSLQELTGSDRFPFPRRNIEISSLAKMN